MPLVKFRHSTMVLSAVALAALAVALVAGVGVVSAEETEEPVAIKDLPKAVVDAIEKEYPDAELLEAEKETENGETLYEVEIQTGGKTLEVEITPEGKIIEVEEEDDGKDDGGDE
jgi:hypothetical protein